jgi:hypothetical protein
MRYKKCDPGAAFHEGDVVVIYNQTPAGKPFIECRSARIVGAGDVADQYRVRFPDNGGTGLRFVYPDQGENLCQSDPDGYLTKVLDEYRMQLAEAETRRAQEAQAISRLHEGD